MTCYCETHNPNSETHNEHMHSVVSTRLCITPSEDENASTTRGKKKLTLRIIKIGCLYQILVGSTVTILICSVTVLPSVPTVGVRPARDARVAEENGTVGGEYSRVSAMRDLYLPYLCRECQVQHWKRHKPSCDMLLETTQPKQ